VKIGIQLYSLRDEMAKDMENTFRRVAEMGFEFVEFAGYFGRSAEEIRTLLDKYGLAGTPVHQGYDFDATEEQYMEWISYLKTLGVRYWGIPCMDKENFLPGEKLLATTQRLNTLGTWLNRNGMELCYHNHDYELETYEGKCHLDRMFDTFDRCLVSPEFDVCWLHRGGKDPAAYIRKHGNYSKIIHLQDYKIQDGKMIFTPLGEGVVDFKSIMSALKSSNIEYLVYEKDDWYDDAFEDARKSIEYLKSIM
jgi:sugar phosphate isomerase/epimerase